MARKRWTAQAEVTDALIKIREKRKWQLAYRRYVMEGLPSEAYAPFFGLDSKTLREWFEAQFTNGLNWENFGKQWQFDHIVPTNYFDYSNEEDLKLCWSFINIRVEPLSEGGEEGNKIEVMAVRSYFQELLNKTGLSLCSKMLDKISAIEASNSTAPPSIESFILQHKVDLETIITLNKEELTALNQGSSLKDLLLEREILRKFGSSQKP
jgi:hypothetical protein